MSDQVASYDDEYYREVEDNRVSPIVDLPPLSEELPELDFQIWGVWGSHTILHENNQDFSSLHSRPPPPSSPSSKHCVAEELLGAQGDPTRPHLAEERPRSDFPPEVPTADDSTEIAHSSQTSCDTGLDRSDAGKQGAEQTQEGRPRGPNWDREQTDRFMTLRKVGFTWGKIEEVLKNEFGVKLREKQLQEKWAAMRKCFKCIEKYEATATAGSPVRSYWDLDAAQRRSLNLKSQSSSFTREWFEIIKSFEEKTLRKRNQKTSRKRQPNLRSKGLRQGDPTDHQPSKSLTTGDSVSGCTGPAASANISDSHQDAEGNSNLESFITTIAQGSKQTDEMVEVGEKIIAVDRQRIAGLESSGKRRRAP